MGSRANRSTYTGKNSQAAYMSKGSKGYKKSRRQFVKAEKKKGYAGKDARKQYDRRAQAAKPTARDKMMERLNPMLAKANQTRSVTPNLTKSRAMSLPQRASQAGALQKQIGEAKGRVTPQRPSGAKPAMAASKSATPVRRPMPKTGRAFGRGGSRGRL